MIVFSIHRYFEVQAPMQVLDHSISGQEMLEKHPNIPPSVRGFLNELTRETAIEELILFGSRAFGDHEERSDADIAVRGDQITPLGWARMSGCCQ